jgi:hypothetical protein
MGIGAHVFERRFDSACCTVGGPHMFFNHFLLPEVTGNQISGQQGEPLQLTHLLRKTKSSWFDLAVVHTNIMEYSPFWEDDSHSAS